MAAVKPVSNWIVQENEGSRVKSGVKEWFRMTILTVTRDVPHKHSPAILRQGE